MLRSNLVCLFVILGALGASSAQAFDAGVPSPQIGHGEAYAVARAKLIGAGWEPIPAPCGKGFICYGTQYPEVTMDSRAARNCGWFRKAQDKLEICLKAAPDTMLVDTDDRS